MIISIMKIISGLIVALFILIIESAFYGFFVWLIYLYVKAKLELPNLQYLDIAYILLAIKMAVFTSFHMRRINHQAVVNPDEYEEKTSDF